MPRNSSGIYSVPLGTKAVPSTLIKSAPYNALIDDLIADANLPRPIGAGGTGASTAEGARTALGVIAADNPTVTGTFKAADRFIVGVTDLGAPAAAGSIAANFATKSLYRVAPAGAATLAVTGLVDGQDGQVNLVYATGTLSFSGVDWWDLGDGTVSASFGATAIGFQALVAGAVYQFVFTRAEGATVGRVGRVK